MTSNLTFDLVIWNKLFRIRCRCLPVAARKPAVEAVAEVAFELFELLVPFEAFERLEVDALEGAFTADQVEVTFDVERFELLVELVEVVGVEVFERRVHKPVTENAAVMFKPVETASDEFVTFEAPVDCSNRRFTSDFSIFPNLPPPPPPPLTAWRESRLYPRAPALRPARGR